jgi:hypothetical protein
MVLHLFNHIRLPGKESLVLIFMFCKINVPLSGYCWIPRILIPVRI